MDKIQREVFQNTFNGQVVEIHFESPKTVKVVVDSKDEILNNVSCIDIMNTESAATIIQLDYATTTGEGTYSTAAHNYDDIFVLD